MTEESELERDFKERRPVLAALGEWVAEKITASLRETLGSDEAVSKFLQLPAKSRVKDTDSFLEKALIRKPKPNPLEEITDQVGVRFVVLLLEDIERICSIVESGPWDARKDRDFQSERRENPDYFAYQSDHFVIRTQSEFEYKGVTISAGMPCEIQIRTILQHAYAEMAHSSAYKPSIKLSEEDQRHVNRSLAKGSALIEITDDVFREIKTKLRDYSESIEALLKTASEVYQEITGEPTNPMTTLGGLVADTYREFLQNIEPDQLRNWAKNRPGLQSSLCEKRQEFVFYRDSIVILLGLLITEHESEVPGRWPVDSQYLEDFYTTLGISTSGLF